MATEYVVLRQGAPDQSDTGAWSEIARATAATDATDGHFPVVCREVIDAR